MNENTSTNISNNPSNPSSIISCRLTLKNIPENLSNDYLIEILNKNFENNLKDIQITKLDHKYNSKFNKICFVTAETFEIRKKVFSFFSNFEMVDPKGFKQKITVVDCLYQNRSKGVKDPIQGTISTLDHFEKFKEYFNEGKIVDFKTDESKFLDKIFEGIEETVQPALKAGGPSMEGKIKTKGESKHSKMIITKKQVVNEGDFGSKVEIIKNPVQINFSRDTEIEVIKQEEYSSKDGSYHNTKFNKNKNYNDNYNYNDSGNYKDYNKKGYNKKYYDNNYNYKEGDNYYQDNGTYYEEGYNNGYNNPDGKYYKDNSYNTSYNNSSYKKGGFKKGGYK